MDKKLNIIKLNIQFDKFKTLQLKSYIIFSDKMLFE